MTSLVKRFLAIVGLLSVVQSGLAEHVKSWGDLSKPGSYFAQTQTRFGIPLIRRELIVKYPQVSFKCLMTCCRRFQIKHFVNSRILLRKLKSEGFPWKRIL